MLTFLLSPLAIGFLVFMAALAFATRSSGKTLLWGALGSVFIASLLGMADPPKTSTPTKSSHPKDQTSAPAEVAAATDAPVATDAPADNSDSEKVIVHGVHGSTNASDTFNVLVGHRIHVEEGMLDDDPTYDIPGEAETLIQAREVGNRSGIERGYGLPIYRDYDNEPSCTVVDQDEVSVDENQDLNYGGIDEPIHCMLSDGTGIYATSVHG
jgi:hypothetical protein